MFKPDQSLKQIHAELIKHLLEYSHVCINGDGRISFYISENGNADFWLDDLVEVVLRKAAATDKEIVNICLRKGIDLFTIEKKKP